MDMIDDLIGGVVTAVAGPNAPAINDFIKSNGGVNGLAQKFQSGGAGEVFNSWVSTGENKAIASEMINQVVGSAQVQQIAQKMGVDPSQASAFIAKALPQVIDKLTPQGTLDPAGGAAPQA